MYTHVLRVINARTARRSAIGLLGEVWLDLQVKTPDRTESEADNERMFRDGPPRTFRTV